MLEKGNSTRSSKKKAYKSYDIFYGEEISKINN